MALEIAIIADDLTGALDTAAPFASHGMRVAVAPFIEACEPGVIADCDVIAINTDSRALAPEAAALEVTRAWRRLFPFRPECVFKKIDSRLKGNIAAETAALMAASGRSRAIVAPAIPEMGRFVVGGAVVGFGVSEALPIAERLALSEDISAPDCTDTTALAEVAALLLDSSSSHMAVGAAGLAERMAEILGRGRPRPAHVQREERRGPLLIISGSRDPITLEQLARLEQSDLRPAVFSAPGRGSESFTIPDGATVIVLRAAQTEMRASSLEVAHALGRVGHGFVEQAGIETVVAVGGDTALAFVREAGIRVLAPDGAAMLGIPAAQAQMRSRALTLITKSGGFGSPQTLVDIARRHAGPGRGAARPAGASLSAET